MMGHINEWFYNGMAGIIPLKPGFSEIRIKPYLPESINQFTCSYGSVKGEITVSIRKNNQSLQVKVDLPKGIECILDQSNLETQGFAVEWIKNILDRNPD